MSYAIRSYSKLSMRMKPIKNKNDMIVTDFKTRLFSELFFFSLIFPRESERDRLGLTAVQG